MLKYDNINVQNRLRSELLRDVWTIFHQDATICKSYIFCLLQSRHFAVYLRNNVQISQFKASIANRGLQLGGEACFHR